MSEAEVARLETSLKRLRGDLDGVIGFVNGLKELVPDSVAGHFDTAIRDLQKIQAQLPGSDRPQVTAYECMQARPYGGVQRGTVERCALPVHPGTEPCRWPTDIAREKGAAAQVKLARILIALRDVSFSGATDRVVALSGLVASAQAFLDHDCVFSANQAKLEAEFVGRVKKLRDEYDSYSPSCSGQAYDMLGLAIHLLEGPT